MPNVSCSIDDCGGGVVARGWCNKHWKRWRMHGDPLHLVPKAPKGCCTVDGCDRQLGGGGRGLCSMHYQRWRINGDIERIRPAGENRYETVDLLTGKLTVVRSDGTEHISLYDLGDHDLISGYTWWINPGGYVAASVGGRKNRGTVLLHRMLLGLDHGDERVGDHLSGDRLDNRRANLRIADYKVNAANQAIINEAGTSKYRGVCWVTRDQKWMAYTHLDGRMRNLGLFDTEEEAANTVFDFRAAHQIELGYARRHSHTPSKSRTA